MYKNIFITGGSGVLGSSVIQELHDFSLYCLVHKNPLKNNNVKIIFGDIQHHQLGLNDVEYKNLCENIDLIIHMAAITNFNMSYEKVSSTNVAGTMNLLQLAKDADVPLYHISTAYVHNFSNGEAYVTQGNGYEISKVEAEELIRNSNIPFTIIRPSIILGDSQTGEIANQQGFHFMAKLLLQNRIPIIPGDADAKIDIVSQDYVANVISTLVRKNHIGGEFFVTLGENAPTLEKAVSSIINYGNQITGQVLNMPKIVSGEIFNRLIKPVFIPKLPMEYRREIKMALYMFKYINITGVLPSSSDYLEKEMGINKHKDINEVILNNIKYLVQSEKIEKLA
ncbi:SDR family oxidoreductase [Bacillus anthracis]|uniref:SDR family oxidoreductase n=1 Tax=Bacillus cereus group TaxID=86661 RepID=UPI002DB6B914|nr:SDR family oxidoreductase [Bacillus anthracis]MEC0017836.1 SDR family oxidoreductase [Bacillus anthracis]